MTAFDIPDARIASPRPPSAAAASDAKLLAGGQIAARRDQARARRARCARRPGEASRDLDRRSRSTAATLVIGAMATHAEVAASPEVRRAHPRARQARRQHRRPPGAQPRHDRRLASPTTIRRPTIPPRCSALGATVDDRPAQHRRRRLLQGPVRDRARRRTRSSSRSRFPIPQSAPAYEKFAQPASRFALVGVFVAQSRAGVRVAVTGAGAMASSAPRRWSRRSRQTSRRRPPRGVKVGRDGAEQRPARRGRVPRAADPRAGAARGRGADLSRRSPPARGGRCLASGHGRCDAPHTCA